MNEQSDITVKICMNCKTELKKEARFCNNCGFAQTTDETYDIYKGKEIIVGLLCFFGLLTIICLIGNFSGHTDIPFLLLADAIFIVITVTGAGIWWKDISPALQWKNFNILKVATYSIATIIMALAVNVIVNWLNKSMFGVETYYYLAFEHLKYAKLITILVIAVQPTIFEELAFRGIIQSRLSRIIDSNQTIYLTAFLFAILHMSFISLFWLIPFGVLLSYLRKKENTLWYGVVMHFFFNATACLLEFFKLNVI